jgi:translocation and assembly module TamA
MPGLRFSRRQYDDLIRPTRGYRFALETRGAAQAFGSDANFLQLLFNGDMLIPLPPFRLFLGLEPGDIGVIIEIPLPSSSLPEETRGVRGYAYQSWGRKIFPKYVDRKHLLTGILNSKNPSSKLFGIAAFYDVGNAFNSLNVDLQAGGAGMGIRLYTPVGTIRLDLARQVGVKDPEFRLHFTVGFQL